MKRKGKRWRGGGNTGRRAPRIRWEVLREEGKRDEYREVTERLYGDLEWDENRGEHTE